MDSSHNIPKPSQAVDARQTLKVDFSWRKFRSLVTEADPNNLDSFTGKPVYLVDYKTLAPNLVIKSGAAAAALAASAAADSSEEPPETFPPASDTDGTISDATLHVFNINPTLNIHGHPVPLVASSRFKTRYTYPSTIFSKDSSPATMTWTSKSDFKNWDFVLLTPDQLPVARFTNHIWATKKVGTIEFLDNRTDDPRARDEVVATGLTLWYTILYRSSSILQFFGAVVGRGVGKDVTEAKA